MPVALTAGVKIYYETYGSGFPMLLLHGFTGSHHTWEHIIEPLQDHFFLITPDLVGHGLSEAPLEVDKYSMDYVVQSLYELLDLLNVSKYILLGYSMGGRIAMRLALQDTSRVTALILESTSPGIEDEDSRQERLRSDQSLADMIEREGVKSFVDYWESLPLFHTQKKLPENIRLRIRAERLSHRPIGLANSLRGLSTGLDVPIWNQLSSIDCPTLLVAGCEDKKYVEMMRRMHHSMPKSSLEEVEGCGHCVHLEDPDRFVLIVSNFLLHHGLVSKGN